MAKNNKKDNGDDLFGNLFGALLGDEEIEEEEMDKLFSDLQGLLGDLEDDDDTDEDDTDEDDTDEDIEALFAELDD